MKIFYLALGLVSFLLGLIGIILPILPTTPFMLLTSFCLLKGSDRLNEKFIKTKFYKEHVKTFKETKGMTLKTKLIIIIPVAIMLGIIFCIIDSKIMKGVIIVLLSIKILFFLKIKTLKEGGLTYDE